LEKNNKGQEMKLIMKRYYKVIVPGIIEILSFLLLDVKNLELFFMIWTFFLNDSREFIRAGNVGTDKGNIQHTQNYFAQKMGEYVSVKNKKMGKTSVDYKIIIILIIYPAINIVGLILSSFKLY
jgi:hypothetical protein